MDKAQIYNDIATRTGGDIYIGVVGPVRTGKSTFIKRFMESAVIPNISDENDKMRARDELPQSAGGKTVMTTEPKFIPDEAVTIKTDDGIEAKVRMIDCVGYLVPDALGNTENGAVRMVNTPWSEEPIAFEAAAEIGTKRVITEHSTIGMLVTSDGSYGDIPRENFADAEARIADELHMIGKPFAVILNSADPENERSERLALELEEKYRAPVALVNCTELDLTDINHIMKMILDEFPIRELRIELPEWCAALDGDHWLKKAITQAAIDCAEKCHKIGETHALFAESFGAVIGKNVGVSKSVTSKVNVDMGSGKCIVRLEFPASLYYTIIGEFTGINITGEKELISILRELTEIKREWEKYSDALNELNEHGYGIVMPGIHDLALDEPEIIKGSGGYGVKLRATAPSIHLIRASINTEINPIVGSEAQSEELIKSLLADFSDDPSKLWESNLFGKSLYELINEGLHAKLEHMPYDARQKISETLGKIINDGSSGLICILL